MFGIENTTGPTGAALVIGIVLLEALVLYVGYGTLESVLGTMITDMIKR